MNDPEARLASADVDQAGRRSRAEYINRRIAQRVGNLDRMFNQITGESGDCTLLCACGREECRATVVIGLADYDVVRAAQYQYVIARGHQTELDEVVWTTDRYTVVEVTPKNRTLYA